jgi:hypothetical protein
MSSPSLRPKVDRRQARALARLTWRLRTPIAAWLVRTLRRLRARSSRGSEKLPRL